MKKTKTIYTVEQNGNILYKTVNIEKIFAFFQDPREYQSQEIMKGLDELIPEKPKKRLRKVRV